MKANELIEILQKLDPETLILVDGYEGGYTELDSIHEQYVEHLLIENGIMGNMMITKKGNYLNIKQSYYQDK